MEGPDVGTSGLLEAGILTAGLVSLLVAIVTVWSVVPLSFLGIRRRLEELREQQETFAREVLEELRRLGKLVTDRRAAEIQRALASTAERRKAPEPATPGPTAPTSKAVH